MEFCRGRNGRNAVVDLVGEGSGLRRSLVTIPLGTTAKGRAIGVLRLSGFGDRDLWLRDGVPGTVENKGGGIMSFGTRRSLDSFEPGLVGMTSSSSTTAQILILVPQCTGL